VGDSLNRTGFQVFCFFESPV